jgi:hypothetical protein
MYSGSGLNILTTLECTIFFGVTLAVTRNGVTEEEEVFCCSDEAAAAESPIERKEKGEKRRKAEENTVVVVEMMYRKREGCCILSRVGGARNYERNDVRVRVAMDFEKTQVKYRREEYIYL